MTSNVDHRALRLLQQIATIANESETVQQAVPPVLEQICRYLDWPVGHAYLRQRGDDPVFVDSGLWWCESSERFERLMAASRQMRFRSGEGLVGRVAATSQAHSVLDVRETPDFLRGSGDDLGVRSALLLPVVAGTRILGVLEFFHIEPAEPDPCLLDGCQTVGMEIGHVVERQQSREALRQSEERLELAIVGSRGGLWDTWFDPDDPWKVPEQVYFCPHAKAMLGYAADEFPNSLSAWMSRIHPQDLPRFQRLLQDYVEGRAEFGEVEYRAYHRDGSIRWIYGRGDVKRREDGTPLRATGINWDMTERKQLEEALAEVAAGEQQRIGQELHDSVAQQLTGIAMVAETLRQKLDSQESELTERAALLVQQIRETQRQVRALAHGMIPVEVEAGGLPAALARLAERTRQLYNIDCIFHCGQAVLLDDNASATHLYRIAQEAIHNAVRHAQPSRIIVELEQEPNRVRLAIRDDGVGIAAATSHKRGAGLHVMRYRAGLIGGQLEVRSQKGRGTTVLCTIHRQQQGGQDQ